MAICASTILYLVLERTEIYNYQKKLSAKFYTCGLKIVENIAATGYKIAVALMLSFLK
jgi:hypothetical protein